MGWPLLYVVRQVYHGNDNWGILCMPKPGKDLSNNVEWEKISYTYELPWKEDSAGHSQSKKSQIDIGTYEMHVRTDGPKGWRLELEGTAPRGNIQVHRAHKSMYIQGCILPVSFNHFGGILWQKGSEAVEILSMLIMLTIQLRYERLAEGKTGKPTITIAAMLPASVPSLRSTAVA